MGGRWAARPGESQQHTGPGGRQPSGVFLCLYSAMGRLRRAALALGPFALSLAGAPGRARRSRRRPGERLRDALRPGHPGLARRPAVDAGVLRRQGRAHARPARDGADDGPGWCTRCAARSGAGSTSTPPRRPATTGSRTRGSGWGRRSRSRARWGSVAPPRPASGWSTSCCGATSGRPTRSARGRTPRQVTLEDLVMKPAQHDGKTVTVKGQFRGKNLYGDLPSASRQRSADWVLKDDVFAVWVSGKKAKGEGWTLDPDLKRDTGKWLSGHGAGPRRPGRRHHTGDRRRPLEAAVGRGAGPRPGPGPPPARAEAAEAPGRRVLAPARR